MNKFRLESSLTASPLAPYPASQHGQWATGGRSRPSWLIGSGGRLVLGLSLWAFLLAGTATEAEDRRTNVLGPRCKLTITVRNPHCPACLKSLKTYLLTLNGVRDVSMGELKVKNRNVDIRVKLVTAAQAARVIEGVKAHDFEILGTKKSSIAN